MKRQLGWLVAAGCLLAIGATGCATSQTGASSAKENFYVFLCFGQSNMEGYPRTIEEQDKTVDERFQVLAAVDFKDPNRTKGNWYPAVPPLCRPGCGLCPADYFGRTLVANLPKNVKVGVINVSVAGCKIEMFQKDKYEAYAAGQAAWLQNIVKQYDGNPYGRLVQLAKQAQQVGVIKGIILHQGESNGGDREWGTKVKSVYDDLLKDLELKPDSLPLLGGELVGSAGVVSQLPKASPNFYVISSKGCGGQPGGVHFSSAGYRELGKRYGEKMLELMGVKVTTSVVPAVAQAAAQPAAR
jgi:hypothetical protein